MIFSWPPLTKHRAASSSRTVVMVLRTSICSMHAYIARRSSASEGSQPLLGHFRAHGWILRQLHIPKWSKTDTLQQTNSCNTQLMRQSPHFSSLHCPKEHGLCQTGDSIGVSSHSLEAFLCMTQTHAHIYVSTVTL